MTNDEVVHRYIAAYAADDRATLGQLKHPDWVVDYPQSGERIRGHVNMTAIMDHYPGGAPEIERTRVMGSEDRYVMTPSFTFERVVGSGDLWWGDGLAHYPDGSRWHIVILVELRDGKVWRETDYFAAPFEAPAWRSPWVERIADGG
jgi:hypothetical protein